MSPEHILSITLYLLARFELDRFNQARIKCFNSCIVSWFSEENCIASYLPLLFNGENGIQTIENIIVLKVSLFFFLWYWPCSLPICRTVPLAYFKLLLTPLTLIIESLSAIKSCWPKKVSIVLNIDWHFPHVTQFDDMKEFSKFFSLVFEQHPLSA